MTCLKNVGSAWLFWIQNNLSNIEFKLYHLLLIIAGCKTLQLAGVEAVRGVNYCLIETFHRNVVGSRVEIKMKGVCQMVSATTYRILIGVMCHTVITTR
jgi:hypothetical protein